MYRCQTLKNSVVWLLVFSLTHLPVPWVHRHSDLKESELAPHLAAYHEQMTESEVGNGWHIHFLARTALTDREGIHQQSFPNNAAPEKCQTLCSEIGASIAWLRRAKQRGQRATTKVADLIVPGNLVSADFVRHSRWNSMRDGVAVQSVYCVFLI